MRGKASNIVLMIKWLMDKALSYPFIFNIGIERVAAVII